MATRTRPNAGKAATSSQKQFEGVVAELYDVVVLPGVRRPTALGFKSDEIRRVISVGASPDA